MYKYDQTVYHRYAKGHQPKMEAEKNMNDFENMKDVALALDCFIAILVIWEIEK